MNRTWNCQGALCNSTFVAALIVFILIAAIPAQAATRTWTGVNTNWNDVSNWGGALPGDGDAVIIPDLAIDPALPSADYPASGSFLSFELQAGAIVTCLGDTNVVNVPSGGTVAAKHGAGVTINCQGATIAGALSADAMGFLGWGPNIRYPGPGLFADWSAVNASHGGLGMSVMNTIYRYGSLTQPTALGSGAYHTLSQGGGAIKIAVTNTLTVNGRVTANGTGSLNSAASGGSVWLLCNQLAGTGTISAIGGTAAGAAGGGGRISIECQSNAFQGAIKVGGGGVASGGLYGGKAQAGTLWFPKWMTGREGTQDNPTNLCLSGPEFGVRYWFANSSVTQYWNIYMTNSWLELYAGSAVISNLCVVNGCFWINESNMSNLAVFGMMYLTNATAYLPAYGVYDMPGDFTMADTGTVVYALGDTNAINADSGGTESIKHGAGLGISCRNAVISGRIDGDGLGFGQTRGPGAGIYSQSGASYGGQGGLAAQPTTRPCYGSLTRPTALGSAGYSANWADKNTPGGGAVRVTASGTLTLNGTISVNGMTPQNTGPSGGCVWLQAGTFAGNGLISANGAPSGGLAWFGGGGGGRIAIEYGAWNFTGTNSVKCGNPEANGGNTGTIFLCKSPWLGTTTSNGVNGRQLDAQFSISSNNVRIARSIIRFDTSLIWRDYSTDSSGSTVVSNIVTYTIRGLRPSRTYAAYMDGTQLFDSRLSSASGALTFTNTLDRARTFFLTPAEKGTIITIY